MSFFLIDFFKHLGDDIKKAYNKLTQEEKDALAKGTGLTEIINNNLTAAPAEIRKLIQEKFPAIPETALEAALFEILDSFNLTKATNIDDAIVLLQQWLSGRTGKAWAYVSHSIATAFSAIFAPAETKVGVIVNFIEWIYQTFLKKK